MEPTTSNINSRSIFPYHLHNQVGFDNDVNNGRGFIYLGIWRIVSFFKYLQEFKVVYQ